MAFFSDNRAAEQCLLFTSGFAHPTSSPRRGSRTTERRRSSNPFLSSGDSSRSPFVQRSSSSGPDSANHGGNSSSGSGTSSSRQSRASELMMNLFSRRSRRERGDPGTSLPFDVPVVDDLLLMPAVPSYIRNNTGWENMLLPPYEQTGRFTGKMVTTPMTTGAPYPLSNIPAHIYLLQPQQPVAVVGKSGGNENDPGLSGKSSSRHSAASRPPANPSFQPQSFPPVYQWPLSTNAAVPAMPVTVPLQGYVSFGANLAAPGIQSQTAVRQDRSEVPARPFSPDSSSGISRHSSSHSYGSSPTEGRHRSRRPSTPRNSRGNSPLYRGQRCTISAPKKIKAHICSGCGRIRSRKFHDANPVRPGKKAITNFCRKCRNSFDRDNDAQYTSGGETRECCGQGSVSYSPWLFCACFLH